MSRRSQAGGALVLSSLLVGELPRPGVAPLRLGIFYGHPSLVNGAHGDLERAVRELAAYDVLVLGDGLEFDADGPGRAGRTEHRLTMRIIERLKATRRATAVYGYVDLGLTQRLPLSGVVDRIDRWAATGVDGVLLDEAGYDFGVTRERQNAAVDAAHARGLGACLNAFRPDDVFGRDPQPVNAAGGGNPDGLRPRVDERDALLIESFAVRAGAIEPDGALTARMRPALAGRARYGTRVFAMATGGAPATEDPALAAFGWWTAALMDVDAYGYAAPDYGAPTSELRWQPRPVEESVLATARYTAERQANRRGTSAGTLVVDLEHRRGSLVAR